MKRTEDDQQDGGYFLDDGTRVDEDSIPVPELCMSCAKNEDGEIACGLVRMDQTEVIRNGETFCCFAYEPKDPNIDGKAVLESMRKYLSGKRDEGQHNNE